MWIFYLPNELHKMNNYTIAKVGVLRNSELSFKNWQKRPILSWAKELHIKTQNHKCGLHCTDKIRFSSYIRKFRGIGCKIIIDQRPPHIWGKICAFPHILKGQSCENLRGFYMKLYGKLIFMKHFIFPE